MTREATRAKQNAYRAAHPDLIREWKRRHYERHGEAIRAKERDRHLRNPEKRRRAALEWQRANPELAAERNHRYRARKLLAAVGDITLELLAGKLAYWGGRCWMCGGEPTGWDHVKPLARGGAHVLANLRPACRRCNSSKKDCWEGPRRMAGQGPAGQFHGMAAASTVARWAASFSAASVSLLGIRPPRGGRTPGRALVERLSPQSIRSDHIPARRQAGWRPQKLPAATIARAQEQVLGGVTNHAWDRRLSRFP
jgi:5-methylcytosine-specific restriction endonuclease McrA